MTIMRIQKELEKFGLSKNQAVIYVLLIQHGELRVQEISNLAQIPRSSVYESLKTLFELGLAEEIVEDSFKKVKPYPLGSMRHGLDEKILKLQKLTADLGQMEKNLSTIAAAAKKESTKVRYYKDIAGARQLLWNTLKTKDTVYVYSSWGRGRYVGINFYKKFVSESLNRGVKERVLINPNPRVLNSLKQHYTSPLSRTVLKDIRTINDTDVLIKGETFIYGCTYSQVYLKGQEINGFEIESQQFTDTQRSIFETLWKMAKPLPFDKL